ncbi:hypothetical protein PY310_20820 [Pseudarthrobacter sp. H3Y2-7]|uniref:hypothetical protein n=1 Tax=Pseudarthrobacter naphthalenicus TaxID=3031328 RepID=UPI0023B1EAC9|nr:hypothetical protein [Pseudarthrobacter sp. H3Y2-7]MDE8671006.1 hypothetical protein [Pseudarthrobacter sp. H3Y2-7]
MSHATFDAPDRTTVCRLDEFGLKAFRNAADGSMATTWIPSRQCNGLALSQSPTP